MPAPATFLFAVCQGGAEQALRLDVARVTPSLRLAFSRPGFVTLKWVDAATAGPPKGFELRTPFARVWGTSIGKATEAAGVVSLGRGVSDGRPLRLHVYAREGWRPDEEPPEAETLHAHAAAVSAAIRAGAPPRLFAEGDAAIVGERVLDVVTGEPHEPLWVGWHVHHPWRSALPGGRFRVEGPADAPSRAWRKLEEALAWARLPLRPGDTAVEIGCAPGGASAALLARGLRVVGVDPGEMAASVLASPRFHHERCVLGELRVEALPQRVEWLLLDVNIAPQAALHQFRRLVAVRKRTLLGAVLTLKMNDLDAVAALPALLTRVQAMFGADATLHPAQLPANRSEVCVVVRTPAGRQRAGAAA